MDTKCGTTDVTIGEWSKRWGYIYEWCPHERNGDGERAEDGKVRNNGVTGKKRQETESEHMVVVTMSETLQ